MLCLTQDIGHRLRLHEMMAGGVQITVKDNGLACRQYQTQLPAATQSPMELAVAARGLFENNYDWHTFVRAVTVRAINLEPLCMPRQFARLAATLITKSHPPIRAILCPSLNDIVRCAEGHIMTLKLGAILTIG